MRNFATWIVGGHVPMISGKPITASTLQLIGLTKKIGNMPKKMTKEEFVEKANKKHGVGRYCYDDSYYQGSKIPLYIKCNVCNEIFLQTPNSHLSGQGCPECAKQKRRNFKPVCGVGINDLVTEEQQVDGVCANSYKAWHAMINRCYNENYKCPTYYKDCVVCDEWLRFSNFKKWFDDNYIDGYALDKDILVKGNKVYSPDTCCFVPQGINSIFTKRQNYRGKYPIGVFRNYKGYGAKVTLYGTQKHLGTYNTIEKAFVAYKQAKEAHIKEVAEKYYSEGKITKRVYDALMRYEVEITD